MRAVLFLNTMSLIFASAFSGFPSTSLSAPLDSIQFGIATAPAQTEDGLDDIWSDWAKQGKISGFEETPDAAARLRFFSNPEPELDAVSASGISVYRLGLDWQRIMPEKDRFDEGAILHYRKLLQKIRGRKLKIMISIMHHSIPKWAQVGGGWLTDRMKIHFLAFAKKLIEEFHDEVEWWATFNEGNIFVSLAYTQGLWPPGETRSPLSFFSLGPFRGDAIHAMDRMIDAHNELHTWAHSKFPGIKIGLAHNMARYRAKKWKDRLTAFALDRILNWHMPERARNHMDFFGFNYYGAEWMKGSQIDIDPEEEYSEAGRAIDPNGLLELLREISQRFKGLPILITENGIADSTDWLRPAYLIEHLKAVEHALQEQIPVRGYFVWTLSDNLEWSDGYCPKFGLWSVERKNGLLRTPRASFGIFQEIVKTRMVSGELRERAWALVHDHQGKPRPFCRADDGVTALPLPRERPVSRKDWRFNPRRS
ncbi:MAG: family 1 glycosylhydrolase [Bdellovibrionales bacterium]|nr:family 1 glycosylhydrolase [Bdellovibrionales bacterium]